jgi:hypothetical protein
MGGDLRAGTADGDHADVVLRAPARELTSDDRVQQGAWRLGGPRPGVHEQQPRSRMRRRAQQGLNELAGHTGASLRDACGMTVSNSKLRHDR